MLVLFYQVKGQRSIYQDILDFFQISCMEMLAFSRKHCKHWFNEHEIPVLDGQRQEKRWSTVKMMMQDVRTKSADELQTNFRATWLP